MSTFYLLVISQRTLQCMEEVVEGLLVELKSLLEVISIVSFCCLLDQLNGFLWPDHAGNKSLSIKSGN